VAAGRYYLFAEHEGFLKAAYGQVGRFPIGQILEVGAPDRVLVASAGEAPREVPAALQPMVAPAAAISPLRGGLGRDAQGLPAGAGAPSAISNGPTAIRATGAPRNLLQDLSFELTPAPAITGTVSDDRGSALAAATVQAYQARFTPMNGRTLQP